MLSKFEELKLLAKCAIGDDRDAFGKLVEAYQPGMRRFFMNLTLGDAALSDDLAQETFVKAYLSIRSFKGLSQFKTWLYRIAYNEFYNEVNRHHELPEQEGFEALAPTHSPTDASDAKMDAKVALSCLNETERTVVTLFYIDDQPLKKITEITGLPEGTVKSHLSRAKTKMANALSRN